MNNKKNSLGANVIIRDFLCYLVMHWKSVLIAAVVCALLMAGYSYHRSSSQINSGSSSAADSAQEASTAGVTESISGDSSDSENAELDSKATILGGYYTQRELFGNYCKNSKLMQCDPANTVQNILDYRITVTGSGSGAQDDLVTLAELCQKSLLDETFVSEMADSADADARYISELITQTIITDASQTVPADSQTFNSNSSSANGNSSGSNSVYASAESDENSEIWRITVVGPDTDTVESISRAVQAYIEQERTNITGSVGQYSISLLNSVQYTGASNVVRSTQNNVYRSMDDINSRIKSIEDDLTNSEMTYIENKIGNSTSAVSAGENDEPQSGTENRKPSISKKYVAAGFVLGLLLAALYWLFRYSFGHTIQSVNEFDNGATDRFYAVNNSGRKLRGIESARYRGRHIYTPAQLTELFMAELEVETKRHESGTFRLCFAGTAFSGNEKKFIDEISSKCEDSDVFVYQAEQVSRNPEAIRMLSDTDAVCVMGDVGGTVRSDYQELMQYLEERNCAVFAEIAAI